MSNRSECEVLVLEKVHRHVRLDYQECEVFGEDLHRMLKNDLKEVLKLDHLDRIGQV